MAVDNTGKSHHPPRIEAETENEKDHFKFALGRRKLRMERKKLAGGNKKEGGLAWNWSDTMAGEISTANIYGLLKVANAYDLLWVPTEIPTELAYKYKISMEVNKNTWGMNITTIRITGLVSCDMKKMFNILLDVNRRKEWDLMIEEGNIATVIDSNNDVEWRVYKELVASEPGSPRAKKDFALLRTWKYDEDRYIISSRSIRHPSCPEKEGYDRGEVFPSGFLLTPWSLDDGMGRDEDEVAQTSFDYVIQLDENSAKMMDTEGGSFVKILTGSLNKLCAILEVS